MFNKKSEKCEIITFKNDYYVVNSDKNNYINVPLYVSVKDSILIDKEEISNICLVNDIESEIIPVSIVELSFLKEVDYDNKTFYQYDLKLEIDFIINNLTILDDVYLKISYHSMEFVKILIGNISLYNYSLNDQVYYTSLKGITNNYENNEMLVGVLVKLETINDLNIVEIKSMNSNVSIDLEKSYVLDECETNDLKDLINENYNIIGSGNSNNDIVIKSGDYLFISLKYKDYVQIPIQGFVLKYLNNEEMNEKVITPFMFYKTNNVKREMVKVVYEVG
ncbi:MAG: hypothetical protein IJB21_00280 [Bacilli bacterium]|nr:hypothetical protein [Bacilli bacterium]